MTDMIGVECDHDWCKWFVKDDAGNAVWNGDINCACGARDRVPVPDSVCEGCDGTGGPDKNCAGCGGTGAT